jgi:hypothetical protein
MLESAVRFPESRVPPVVVFGAGSSWPMKYTRQRLRSTPSKRPLNTRLSARASSKSLNTIVALHADAFWYPVKPSTSR